MEYTSLFIKEKSLFLMGILDKSIVDSESDALFVIPLYMGVSSWLQVGSKGEQMHYTVSVFMMIIIIWQNAVQ